MRLFLWLTAALVAILNAQADSDFGFYPLPNGLPIGSVLTILFKHTGALLEPESVAINFYDVDTLEKTKNADIPAHLRIDRHRYNPVESNSWMNGAWQAGYKPEQPLDELPISSGYWRVDVIRFDAYRMNVFFQGFWSDVRTFHKSLDNLRSVVATGHFVDKTKPVQFSLKLPNSNLVPPTFADFKRFLYSQIDPPTLITLPGFPIGAHIDMVAVLRASAGQKHRKPMLGFVQNDGADMAVILAIVQMWNKNSGWFSKDRSTHKLFIATQGGLSYTGEPQGTTCLDWNTHPNGDLVHMRLERIRYNVVMLSVGYKPEDLSRGRFRSDVKCWHEIPTDLAKRMDRPFQIVGGDGGHLLHIDHSIPTSVQPADPAGAKPIPTGHHSRNGISTYCVGENSHMNEPRYYCCTRFENGDAEHNCYRVKNCDRATHGQSFQCDVYEYE